MLRYVFLSKNKLFFQTGIYFFRQNDIKTKFIFYDIRLTETKFHLGRKKTGF